MVISAKGKILGNLVDVERGLIRREVFTSEELFQQQLERVFARCWVFIGHESQIPNPNDFFVSKMGGESVILTRDRQGEVHVLLNTCRHRGMKVCRYDEGNTPVFSCPYHGWSYSTDGRLVSVPGELIGVPQFQTAYHGELKKEDWGMVSVPKMYNYKGSIWACWDKDAPEWDDYMGDMKLLLDFFFDSSDGEPGGVEVIGGVEKVVYPANWMYGVENFIGDTYHGVTSHRSVDLAGISPQGGFGRAVRRDYGVYVGSACFPDLGHGTCGISIESPDIEYQPSWPNNPEVDEYYRWAHEKRTERIRNGEARFRPGTMAVFPSSTFHPSPMGAFAYHPISAMRTERWHWYLIDKKAPQAAKDALRHYGMRYAGPTGMTEEDDMENWNYATAASKGTIASRYPFNYEMGLGHELAFDRMHGATITDRTSYSFETRHPTEANARVLYKRWAELMDAESWDDLYPRRRG